MSEHVGPSGLEMVAAVGAAAMAAYVRSRGAATTWTLREACALGAEAIVCGALAQGVAALAGTQEVAAMAAALALIGTRAISEIILRMAQRKASGD